MAIDKKHIEGMLEECERLEYLLSQEDDPDETLVHKWKVLNESLDETVFVYKATDGHPDWAFVYLDTENALIQYMQNIVEATDLEKIYVGQEWFVNFEVVEVSLRELAETPIYEP